MKPVERAILATTEEGTPLGELMRRYWIPCLVSEELPRGGGPPVRVRLMGEDLVAFRDGNGDVGLLGNRCSHRGVDLFFGTCEPDGLRCAYHGWKYDREGRCLEMPNTPHSSTFKEKIQHPAYPCVEMAGVVWAYLGLKEHMPEPPQFEFLTVPDHQVYAYKRVQQCYWMRALEGDIDGSHVAFLHDTELAAVHDAAKQAREGARKDERFEFGIGRDYADDLVNALQWQLDDTTPHIETIDTDCGLMIATRRNTDRPEDFYWRVNQWMYPCFTSIPVETGDGPLAFHAWVPIDDHSTWVYTFLYHPSRPLTEEEFAGSRAGTLEPFIELEPGSFTPELNKRNDYGAEPTRLEGDRHRWMIPGIQTQDIAMTESIHPDFDTGMENMTASDAAILQVRRRLIEGARMVQDASRAPGVESPESYRVRPYSFVLDADSPKWPEAVRRAMEGRPETFTPAGGYTRR